jgi:uncharacterized GH25 family protein
MKKPILILLFFTFLSSLSAHEFWLSPDKFLYKRGEKINIRFQGGENFEGENWRGNKSKIQSLNLYYGGVRDDLSGYFSEEAGDSLEIQQLDEGTNLVAFNSTNSYIGLDAEKFNAYLQEDGLENVIEYRKQNNETDSMGREFYQRCSKTIFQVGMLKDKTFATHTGLPLDIIPQQNPYQLKNADSLKVKILFLKNPLPNTLIKLWHRDQAVTYKKDLRTDENGECSLPVTLTGKWMVSTIRMERIENNPTAQWQSYHGSLTWGYD